MPDQGYLHNRREEQAEVMKSAFWKDFVEKASEKRAIASRRCEIAKADQRFYQGQIEMFDSIFGRTSEDGVKRESIIEKMWKEKKGETPE